MLTTKVRWSRDPSFKRQMTLHEGTRQFPYLDTVKKVSIGIGRNLTDVGVSPDEIALMFANDVRTAEMVLDANVPWWRALDFPRQRIMLDMCFNMGWSRYRKFTGTIGCIKDHNFDGAAYGMKNSLWASQVGSRADRLIGVMSCGKLPPELS